MKLCDFLFFTLVAGGGAALFVFAGCRFDIPALLVLAGAVLLGSSYLIRRTRRRDRGEL
ncbi:hypothetical protein LJB68_00035 [bacterium 210820-DFI.6.52]|nr:hypothetical protein [bacterium 210820-DFI.6.52]